MLYSITLQTFDSNALEARRRFLWLSALALVVAVTAFWLTHSTANIRYVMLPWDFVNEASGMVGVQALGYFVANGISLIGHQTLLPKLRERQRNQRPPRDEVEAIAQRLHTMRVNEPPTTNSFLAYIHLLGMLALHGGVVAPAFRAYESIGHSPIEFMVGYVGLFVASIVVWVYAVRFSLRP